MKDVCEKCDHIVPMETMRIIELTNHKGEKLDTLYICIECTKDIYIKIKANAQALYTRY